MDKRLNSISTCNLIFELLHDGAGGIYPTIEPISPEVIFTLLRRRHSCNLENNVESWVEWFLGSPELGTQSERDSIATAVRIKKIEKDALRKMDDEDQS